MRIAVRMTTCLLTLAILLPAADVTAQVDIDWNGGTGDWATGTNWVGGVVPGAVDNAFINNGGTAQVTSNVGTIGEAFSNKGFSIGTSGNTGTVEVLAGGDLSTNNSSLMSIGVNAGSVGTLRVNGGSFTSGIANNFVGADGGTGTIEVIAGSFFHNPGGIILGDSGGNGTLDVSGTGSYTGGNLQVGAGGSTSNVSLSGDTASIDMLRNIISLIGGTATFNLTAGLSGIDTIDSVATGNPGTPGSNNGRGRLALDGLSDTLNVDLTNYGFGSNSLTLFTWENISIGGNTGRSGVFETVNVIGGVGTLVYDDVNKEVRLDGVRVPEPSALAIALLGLTSMPFLRRRR